MTQLPTIKFWVGYFFQFLFNKLWNRQALTFAVGWTLRVKEFSKATGLSHSSVISIVNDQWSVSWETFFVGAIRLEFPLQTCLSYEIHEISNCWMFYITCTILLYTFLTFSLTIDFYLSEVSASTTDPHHSTAASSVKQFENTFSVPIFRSLKFIVKFTLRQRSS